MISAYWTLDGRLAVPCEDMDAWGRWMQQDINCRRVADTTIGALWVSTVFLGLDHNFGRMFSTDPDAELPLLFETMIFGDLEDSYQTRCATWEEAEAMHQAAVRIATKQMRAADVMIANTVIAMVEQLGGDRHEIGFGTPEDTRKDKNRQE